MLKKDNVNFLKNAFSHVLIAVFAAKQQKKSCHCSWCPSGL